MVDFPSLLPAGLPADPALLPTLLDLLPMGVIYYDPVVDAAGTLTDLALAYLNPAAQRMTGMPAQPNTTYRQQFPTTDDNGAWDFHRRTWLSGQPQHFQFYYDADGFDAYFRVASQRLGEGLLAIFTDTQDEVRSQAELALLDSQARERAARTEAEHQQAELRAVFEQAPVAISLLQGPTHVIEFANTHMAQMWGRPLAQVVGQPHFTALPDLGGQGFEAVLDTVWRTGEPYYLQEQTVTINRAGQLYQGYFNITYQPSYNGQGQRTGIITSAIEVTEQVRARQQAEQLNAELEIRVQQRTQEALALQADLLATTQQQATEREAFYQVFEQTPAAVSLLRGPGYRFDYVNPVYQQVFAGRQLVGLNFAEALPDAAEQGYLALLDGVYQTGETFFGAEVPFVSEQPNALPYTTYFNFTYQAYREHGEIVGVSTFALDVTEQVLARQMRENQRRELTALFEQAPVGVCIFDGPELVYSFVNPAYQLILPDRELLGRSVLDVIPELRGTEVEVLLRQVYSTGQVYRAQEHCIPLADPNGSGELENRYFTLVYQPRRDDDQRITGVLNLVFEVTEQVLARQQLEASARQVRDLVAGVPFPIGLYAGPEFQIELANQAILAGWGKGQDVIGQRFVDVMPELQAQGVVGQLQQVLATGQALHLRGQQLNVVMAGQLQTFFYNYSFTPLRDAQGQVYGILNTAADVTDQVVAHQRLEAYAAELQESESRFRTLADAAPNIVWDLHPDGSVRYVNTYCLAFLGISLAEFVSSGWGPYLLPEDVAPTQQMLGQAINERTLFSMEHRLRRHDGQYRWLRTQGGPSYYPSGELYGYVGSAIDITELKQTNEQLTRTNVDLDNFIYTASHDLKAPITNIEGLLLALEHELPAAARPGDVPLMLTMMQEATERFRRTINHLTDLSRLQKEHNPDNDAVGLASVVEAVRLDLTPLLTQTQGRLVVTIPKGLTVTFAEKNLRSVVYNLLSNAFKYHHPDRQPEVQLRSWLAEGYTVLEVQDNGLGLDLSQGQEKLFAMFQRLHTHVEGTGVGLYMVKRVLENAGGRIEVSSQLGQGSTFRVYFRR